MESGGVYSSEVITEFTELQVSQLRSVLREAIRSELEAATLRLESGQGETPGQVFWHFWHQRNVGGESCQMDHRTESGTSSKEPPWSPVHSREAGPLHSSADVRAKESPGAPISEAYSEADLDVESGNDVLGAKESASTQIGQQDVDAEGGNELLGVEVQEQTLRTSRVSNMSRSSSRSFIPPGYRGVFYRCHRWVQGHARRLVHENPLFDLVVGIIVVSSSIVIGFETQYELEGKEPAYFVLAENIFLACFLVELAVRFVADGRQSLRSGWFWFDLMLVLTGVGAAWILEPISRGSSPDDLPLVSQLLTLRILRLMRLARAFRMLEQFKELWKLCSGLIRSCHTMASVCVLMLSATFVFACLGVDLITQSEVLTDDEETSAIIQDKFSSVPIAMLTLMQFANADSIADIYWPMCKKVPALTVYFIFVWIVMTVTLMNLITAVIVENAMANGREEAEQHQRTVRKQLKKILPDIERVFHKLDKDKNGKLTIDEIQLAAETGEMSVPTEIQDLVAPDRLLDMYEFLDGDGSGAVDKHEFVDGICSLAISAVPIETTQILHLLRHTHELMGELQLDFSKLSEGQSSHVRGRKRSRAPTINSTGSGVSGDRRPSGR